MKKKHTSLSDHFQNLIEKNILDRRIIDTPNTHVHDLSLSWHCTSTSTNRGGVRVTRSLVLCVCFIDGFLSYCPFSFGHCVVCSSSISGFWLHPWYLQTLLQLVVLG